MGHFDILLGAVALELLFGTRFDHNGHTLLRLADRQLRRIQTAVLGRHAIEVNIQAVGQLADGYAHTARTEVVRLLDQARHFRTAEQPLQLALFGGRCPSAPHCRTFRATCRYALSTNPSHRRHRRGPCGRRAAGPHRPARGTPGARFRLSRHRPRHRPPGVWPHSRDDTPRGRGSWPVRSDCRSSNNRQRP